LEFTVPISTPFSLEYTMESGQLFRWERRGDWWQGVVEGTVLMARQEAEGLRCVSGSDAVDGVFVKGYFRLDEDLNHILGSIAKDDNVTRATLRFYGLRLVRQPRWECLASFVLATNANIPRIKKMVSAICTRFGEPFEFQGATFHKFPTADRLSMASVGDLTGCGLGYRASFLRHVATSVAQGKVGFSQLDPLGYEEARELLLTELPGEKVLLGVGPKVADCVLLYSCGKEESFPIDVWIAKVLAKSYPKLLGPALKRKYARDGKVKLSPSDYIKISRRVRDYFGEYAGYAQQYLYMAAREEASG
jgi:N-glycosylase/DNA lyase